MLSYGFFLDLAIILFATKTFGVFTKRVKLPQVVGALIAGILMGPSCFNFVHESDFLVRMAELGVVMLMFTAGLETDLTELKKTGLASIIIAFAGVILPLAGGYFTYAFFYSEVSAVSVGDVLKGVFIGVVLTATSVSITVETLREMGKLRGKIGTAILGAAIIDDIIGIVVLTLVIGLQSADVAPYAVFVNVGVFSVFLFIVGVGVHFIFKFLDQKYFHMRRIPIYGLVFCLLMAYLSEHFFGIADITGAYFAGLILSNMQNSPYICKKIDITSYMIFSPIFFASIGINTAIGNMDQKMLWFAAALLMIAILTKVIGCGLGALTCKFTKFEALAVGVGMISRGEVALIVAQKGAEVELISPQFFPAIVLVVIITTLITPVLLKLVYRKDKNTGPENSDPPDEDDCDSVVLHICPDE